MKFPVLIIKENEAPLYYFDGDKFGLVSKGGESFYKKGMIYDSEGNRILISGIESFKNASILKSIKYFQSMKQVSVKYSVEEKVTLSEFKELIIKHIKLYKKYWTERDLIENLEEAIMQKISFQEIISFLR